MSLIPSDIERDVLFHNHPIHTIQALAQVDALEMRTEELEQKVSGLEMEKRALSDEVQKVHRDKVEIQQKYEESQSQQRELQRELETIAVATELNGYGHHRRNSSSTTNAKIRASGLANDAKIRALFAENENASSLNDEFVQQLSALRVRVQEKESAVEELTVDRDQWQSRFEQTEQEKAEVTRIHC